MFSYMVYNEKLKMLLFRKSLKPLNLLPIGTLFNKIILFLLMVNIEKLKIKNKQKNCKHLDFTELKGTFEEKIMFSYMVYREKLLSLDILIITETIDFTNV